MTKKYYKQKLPHIQTLGWCYFVTFSLYGALPKSFLENLKEAYEQKKIEIKTAHVGHELNSKLFTLRKQFMLEYDRALDQIQEGPHFLSTPNVAKIVQDELHKDDGLSYSLLCYCIMSNHVHILIDTSIQMEDEKLEVYLQDIMKKIKGRSARFANLELGRTGTFWEKESYDMYIRNEKMLNNVIFYILNNPVNAGLVDNYEKYLWSFVKTISNNEE